MLFSQGTAGFRPCAHLPRQNILGLPQFWTHRQKRPAPNSPKLASRATPRPRDPSLAVREMDLAKPKARAKKARKVHEAALVGGAFFCWGTCLFLPPPLFSCFFFFFGGGLGGCPLFLACFSLFDCLFFFCGGGGAKGKPKGKPPFGGVS